MVSRVYTLLWVNMVIGLLFYCAFSIIPPIKGILIKKEEIMSAQLDGLQRIPRIEEALGRIEKRQALLTTESVDGRIRKIELAVAGGKLNVDDIRSLVKLNEEVKGLKDFVAKDPSSFFELKELQGNYKNLIGDQGKYALKDAVDSQISTIQWVGGIVLGVFGLILAIVFSPFSAKSLTTRPLKQKSAGSDGVGSAAEEEGQ